MCLSPEVHLLTPGRGVIVDVHTAGVSFPEVLQTRGEYQVEAAAAVRTRQRGGRDRASAPEGASVREGDRVAACCMLGAFADVAVAPDFLTFRLSDGLDFAQGAGLVLNYHTAYSPKHRGRLGEGETVLVHGAAGGVGTATVQIAKGLGARTIAVVSSATRRRRWHARPGRTMWCARRLLEGRGEGARAAASTS